MHANSNRTARDVETGHVVLLTFPPTVLPCCVAEVPRFYERGREQFDQRCSTCISCHLSFLSFTPFFPLLTTRCFSRLQTPALQEAEAKPDMRLLQEHGLFIAVGFVSDLFCLSRPSVRLSVCLSVCCSPLLASSADCLAVLCYHVTTYFHCHDG